MIKSDPNGLLGGKVGMPRNGKEAANVEAELEVFALILTRNFGTLTVCFASSVVV